MKRILFLVIILVSGCTSCYIPHGEYTSVGASEYLTTLNLGRSDFSVSSQQWEPGGYKNRTKEVESGVWSCVGNIAKITTEHGVVEAEYKEVGINPLGVPTNTKALVFEPSAHKTLALEILYPLGTLK